MAGGNGKVETYIRTILETYSSKDHPLTQDKICEYLETKFRENRERKSVGAAIENLKNSGLTIVTIPRKGSYIVRDISAEAVYLLALPIICSQHISSEDRQIIVEGLRKQLPPDYEANQMSNMTRGLSAWESDDNASLLDSLEVIGNAIANGNHISYDYMRYVYADNGIEISAEPFTVFPYHLVFKNNHYYLRGYCNISNMLDDDDENEAGGIIYHRLDKIKNVCLELTRGEIPFDGPDAFSAINSGMPYLYADHFENIEFKADPSLVNDIIDWFGKNRVRIRLDKTDNRLYISLKASPMAVRHWVMQYLHHVEIIKPDYLRKSIEDSLKKAASMYNIEK